MRRWGDQLLVQRMMEHFSLEALVEDHSFGGAGLFHPGTPQTSGWAQAGKSAGAKQ